LEEPNTAVVCLGAPARGLAAPLWEDDAALAELLRRVEGVRRERRLQAARARLDEVLAAVGSGHPTEAALSAAVADRDSLTYAVQRSALARVAARRGEPRRPRGPSERRRTAAPRLAARPAGAAP